MKSLAPLFRFLTGLFILGQFATTSFAQTDDASDLDYRFTLVPKKKLPVRYAERPLVLPLRHYELRSSVDLTQLDPETQIVGVNVGASYGVSKNWEVGLLLFPITLSAAKDTGLETPEFIARHQFVNGVFELAFEFSSILPLSGEVSPTLKLISRFHLGSWASLDLAAFVRYQFIDANSLLQAGVPAELRVQFFDALSVVVSGQAGLVDSTRQRSVGWAKASLVYTLSDKNGPIADIGAGVRTSDYVLQGNTLDDPARGNYPSALLFANFYFLEDPDYRASDF